MNPEYCIIIGLGASAIAGLVYYAVEKHYDKKYQIHSARLKEKEKIIQELSKTFNKQAKQFQRFHTTNLDDNLE